MSRSPDLSGVEPFLRELGAYQLEGYRKLLASDVGVKRGEAAGQSIVTTYDLESERRVRDFLKKRFPDESFFGEEEGNFRRDPARYWVLDPIDGTTNFTRSIAYWGPTLARIENGRTVAGWIYFPVLDQMFHAAWGGGAFLDGSPIHSSVATEYTELTTVATTSRFHRSFRLDLPSKQRILGSLIANLAYLASGTFAAIYGRGRIWDLAAGVLIAREAGACVDCLPALESLDLSSLDAQTAPRISVFGRANPELPPLQKHISPGD